MSRETIVMTRLSFALLSTDEEKGAEAI